MRSRIFIAAVLSAASVLLPFDVATAETSAAVNAPKASQTVSDQDVVRFWQAFDAINATTNPAERLRLIQNIYIDRGTRGLHALMTARRYVQQVRTVQEADENTWSHPKFQQILWDDPSVSSIGPGQSVTVVGAYDDRGLATVLFQARGTLEGLPLDQRGAALDDLYQSVLAQVHPRYTPRRPDGAGGLQLADGVFLDAVSAALAEPTRPFVIVIKEIIRGNPTQILGEMLTLIEDGKRSPAEALRLTYPRNVGERVHVPENLYIIGTMNLAHRSLALVDLALRRRFAFISLKPLMNKAWRSWVTALGCPPALNDAIAADRTLGEQFRVGHSFVTPFATPGPADENWRDWFIETVATEIGPLLYEYWYDRPDEAKDHVKKLQAGLQTVNAHPAGTAAAWRSHVGIPVRNLWMLLVYASDLAGFGKALEAGMDGDAELDDLLARLLTVAWSGG